MTGLRARSLPRPLHIVNEALAFLLELAMLAGLAWWGAAQHASVGVRISLAIAAPVIAAVVWGLFAAPRALVKLPLPGALAIKALAFGAAALGVYSIGWHGLAVAFVIVAFANTAIAGTDRDANGGPADSTEPADATPSQFSHGGRGLPQGR